MTRLVQWHREGGQAIEEQPSSIYSVDPVVVPGSRDEYGNRTYVDPSTITWAHGSRPFKLISSISRVTDGAADYFDCLVEVNLPLFPKLMPFSTE